MWFCPTYEVKDAIPAKQSVFFQLSKYLWLKMIYFPSIFQQALALVWVRPTPIQSFALNGHSIYLKVETTSTAIEMVVMMWVMFAQSRWRLTQEQLTVKRSWFRCSG
jgi:hypothetical protein